MSRIKVIHVLGTTNLGGAESRIMDLFRKINTEEVQFDFLVHMNRQDYRRAKREGKAPEAYRTPGYFDGEIEKLGGKIYALPAFRFYNWFAYRQAVQCFFREHQGEYQVVHGHMTSTASIYLPIAKKQGVPVTIAHARSAGVDQGIKGKLTRLLRKNLWKKADYRLTCSALAAEAVFGKEAIFFPNAIETKQYCFAEEKREQLRAQLGISKETFVVGHVGRFHYAKNHEYLLQVFAALQRHLPDSKLLLLGEGPGLEQQKALARELRIEQQVIFAGNQRDMAPYYFAMDYFLLPSRFEGLPGTAIEAQAAGLPCLISDAVAREVAVTELVLWKSITEPPEAWAKQVLADWKKQEARESDRTIYDKLVSQAGYDVTTQGQQLQQFYADALAKSLK